MKPFAESCEQNKAPILSVLTEQFSHSQQVLEIGSGTGQHAVFFAKHLPHLIWQTSDLPENHSAIMQWLDEAGLNNVLPPLTLDVNSQPWPLLSVDAVFSANTAHIMDWNSVEKMFAGIGALLESQGFFCLYGPFNYNGESSSKSNEDFDRWLKDRDRDSGIRDFENLVDLAHLHHMRLVHDIEMPVNNRILVWQKVKVLDLNTETQES
ncbi:MAG: class I SAM-dependent methyltransferase [Gammaproteobacteria bacterium]|nr:class I SAM-dependent methyltransferase [Gammaproteobacteria bacterium]